MKKFVGFTMILSFFLVIFLGYASQIGLPKAAFAFALGAFATAWLVVAVNFLD